MLCNIKNILTQKKPIKNKKIEELTIEDKIELLYELENNKEKLIININKLIGVNNNNNDSVVKDNLYLDLEIFKDNKMKTEDSIFKKINYTTTLFGECYYINTLKNPIVNITEIKLKQKYIKNILENNNLYNLININLKELNNIESELLWFWQEREDHINSLFDLVYFNFPNLNFINNFLNDNDIILSIVNWYKIIITPASTISTPILSLLIPLVFFKFNKIKINFKQMVDILINKCISFDKFERIFGDNIFSKLIAFMSGMIYLIFYVHTSYNSVKMSTNINKFISMLHKKLNLVSTFINNTENIVLCCQNNNNKLICNKEFNNLSKNINLFKNLFNNNLFKNEPTFINNKGLILSTYNKFINNKNELLLIIKFIGKIDLYHSVTYLIRKHSKLNNKICLSKFINKSNYPILDINNVWHPYLNNNPKKNSIKLSKKVRNILITGPNAAGKSTFIKTVAINILLSQTLGISCSDEFKLTPFNLIDTYLHIPDCKGKESLFEAEMFRCKRHIDKVKNLKNNQFIFFIMDELFSSTNYVEGYSAAYAILKTLSKEKNSLSLITTHYTDLTKLEKTTNKRITNYSFNISRDKDNNIKYSYKIKKKLSKQYIALELLKNNNFNSEIIDIAIKESKKLLKKNNNVSLKKKKEI